MKILPKKYSEFLDKGYWDKFFKKLKKQSGQTENFEWYCEYPFFSETFKQIVQQKNNILQIGCGNSLFAEQLYSDGYLQIENIDFSEQTIEEMQKRAAKNNMNLIYKTMDIFKMNYEDKSFDTVLDKGTLDAVFPEDSVQNRQRIELLFSEIFRVLKDDGSYVFISLLQEFILLKVLIHFKQYQIDFYEILADKKQKLPAFMVQIRKSSDGGKITMYHLNKYIESMNNNSLMKQIKNKQAESVFQTKMNVLSLGQRFTLELYDLNNKQRPKYQLIVVDSENKKTLDQVSCGCFIVPQGRETGYLFSHEKGNIDLLNQVGLSRLIIVNLMPGYVMKGKLQEVQNELSPIIQSSLIPKGCTNQPCPYFTDGDDLNEKLVMLESDSYIVEECSIDDEVYRRLIFKSNLNQIQSQFRIKEFQINTESKQYLKEINELYGGIQLQLGKNLVGIDDSYLDFECHRSMIAGLSVLNKREQNEDYFHFLVLGGGLSALSKFIYTHVPNVQMKTIEISQEIIDLGIKLFETPQNENFQIICTDALMYIEELSSKISQQNENQQDAIFIDINSSEYNEDSAPPKEFLKEEFLQKLKICLKTNGLLAINVLQNDNDLKQIHKSLSKYFNIMYVSQSENERNQVLLLQNVEFEKQQIKDNNTLKMEDIIVVDESKIYSKKQLSQMFKEQIEKNLLKNWDNTMNIREYIDQFTLLFPKFNKPFENKIQYYKNEQGDVLSNDTKDKYLQDQACIDKSKKKQQKKKKNK